MQNCDSLILLGHLAITTKYFLGAISYRYVLLVTQKQTRALKLTLLSEYSNYRL